MQSKKIVTSDFLLWFQSYLVVTILTDSIEDPKERERITALFGDEDSTITADETVVIHGFYDAHANQPKAVAEAARVLGYSSPSEFIQSAIKGGAHSDMDHLGVFDGAAEMEATLKEA